MRTFERENGRWHIEPVLEAGKPCAKGFLSRREMQAFVNRQGYRFVAFHSVGWTDGQYDSLWMPYIPGRTNHFQGPADLWGNIAGNLRHSRTATTLRRMANPTQDEIAKTLDNRTDIERLAQSISLSLRNMDLAVENITEFYNEQLVNHMATGALEQFVSTKFDQTLFAHVHAFFMHVGAARDYLGAYCAAQLGMDTTTVDDFTRLTGKLRPAHVGASQLVDYLLGKGYIQPKSDVSTHYVVANWMSEVTALRKEFMHRRPYGDKFSEFMGHVETVNAELGLYRYVRPIEIDHKNDDVLDVIIYHYRLIMGLFADGAALSGQDTNMLTLADDDIVSADVQSA